MKLAFTSDIHIKEDHDQGAIYFQKFARLCLEKNVKTIFLLGDIFDLMCGPHNEYFKKYPDTFKALKLLIQEGREVYYFEGNHDLHLKRLFRKDIDLKKIKIFQKPLIYSVGELKCYISHGDEHDTDLGYKIYRSFLNTTIVKTLANHIVPFKMLDFVGMRASNWSRSKGQKYFDPNPVKEKFRRGMVLNCFGEFDIVIGGHSHIKENYLFEEKGKKVVYYNNGFAPKEGTCLLYENHKFHYEPVI